jgi:hypothetical protein
MVYRALHRRTAAPVVLKAFQYEARALAHKEAATLRRCAGLPGVVQLLEQVEEAMVVYNVTESCQGGTLIECAPGAAAPPGCFALRPRCAPCRGGTWPDLSWAGLS